MRFEPLTAGIRNNYSAIRATTTAHLFTKKFIITSPACSSSIYLQFALPRY